MSNTTQTIAVDQNKIRTVGLQAILGDYAIHTTGTSGSLNGGFIPGVVSVAEPEDGAIDPTTEPHPRVEGIISPRWWPRNWRNMPEYAPINRRLDKNARPSGANAAEKTMITIVLNGCALLATFAFLWSNTFGRLNERMDKIFRYEIGGEY